MSKGIDHKDVRAQLAAMCNQLEPLLQRSDSDPRPVVVMMCGIAGSGKSTLSKAIIEKLPTFQRLSIDGILASRHGICDVDYPRSKYSEYQDEADTIFEESVQQILMGNSADLVLDRSFYAKEDRDYYKELIEKHGGRSVLVYFDVPKDVLWQRICARREAGINADSALEITEELLNAYWEGFEVPDDEDEVICHYKRIQ